METLFIPLLAKATLSKQGLFNDPYAEEVISQLDDGWSRLKIPRKTQVMLALRALIMDEFTRDFIASKDNCVVLHLGCGLDGRFWRMASRSVQWFDLDFPEVINLKKRLLPQVEGLQYIASSVMDLQWLNQLPDTMEETLVIAEGLFMYLSEEELNVLFQALCQKCKKVTFLFDVYSTLTARLAGRHPSLMKTGAKIRCGLDDPRDMENVVIGLNHQKTLYLTESEAVECLPRILRFQFKVAGLFKIVREAHRIWVLDYEGSAK